METLEYKIILFMPNVENFNNHQKYCSSEAITTNDG
jgi:hypothetical protein